MAKPKDDASTDIETKVKGFVKDLNAFTTKLKKTEKSLPAISFRLSRNKKSKSRTPAEQAKLVVAGTSWVCWSSHMSDKARHVLMMVDGKASWKPKDAFSSNYSKFTKAWGQAMKKHGLKNYKGKDGWADGDGFHLELEDSKIDKGHKRAKSCLDEYARLTRKEKKKKNERFEKRYQKLLAPYVKVYEKK